MTEESKRTFSRRRFVQSAGATITLGVAGCIGGADDGDEDYPNEDIRFIIPFGAGGGTDTYNRVIMGFVAEELGVSLQPENIEGAASLRGTGELHRADPDGHTLGGFNPPSTPISWLVDPQEWDITEFEGVARYAFTPYLLISHESQEIDGLDDMLDRYADGELTNVGGQQVGGINHVNAALLQDLYDWQWDNYVGYDGSAAAAQAVASEEVPVGFSNDNGAQALVDAGTVDIVAILSSEGSEAFEDAPTVVDQGYDNIDYIGQITRCIWAPPNTPQDRIQLVTNTIKDVMESDEFIEWADESDRAHNYGGPDAANDALQRTMEEIPDRIDLDNL